MGIGSLLGDLGRGIAKKIAPVAEESISRIETNANDVVGAKDAYFRVGGAFGEKLQQLHMSYQEARAAAQAKLDAPVNLAQQEIQKHPVLRNKAGLDSPLVDVYKEAQAIAHPLAQTGGTLDTLIMQSRGNELRSLNQLKNQNVQQARTMASAQVFGPHMEHVMPYIMPLLQSKDAVQESWARGAMNLISNETRDTVSKFDSGAVSKISSAKQSIADEVGRTNRATRLQAIAAGRLRKNASGVYDTSVIKDEFLKPFDTSLTYTPPGEIERRVQNIFRVVQLPMVALKHLSSIGNFSSIHAPQLVQGMLRMTDPQFKAFLDSTHVLAYTDHDFMDHAMRGGTGMVAKMTGSPTAGKIFFDSYHMPFFDFVRTKQLSFGASVGWAATHNWAAQAMKGSKIAIENLHEIGIDPVEVLKQGGKLTPEQLRKGVFHFVNNRLFMDKTVEQALHSNSNILMRSATMYHTFVNAQSRFFRRELYKMYRAKDYVGLAQFAGTLGILWPAVAPMVKSAEIFVRTLSPSQASASAKKDYGDLTSGNLSRAASTYLNLLSFYAAFGVYTNYVQAAHGDRLAYSMLGPSLGVPARYASDVLNLVTRTDSAGRHNAAPVVRDTLEDFVPIAGNILAHQIAPTGAEEKVRSGRVIQRKPRPKHESAAATRWKF